LHNAGGGTRQRRDLAWKTRAKAPAARSVS